MTRLKIDVMKREHNQEESCSLHSSCYHQFKICIKTRSLMDWISGHVWVPGQKFSKYCALWTRWSSRTNTKWPTCVNIACDLFPRVWDTCSHWSETRSLLAMWLPELTAVVLEMDQCERKCQCQIFLEFKYMTFSWKSVGNQYHWESHTVLKSCHPKYRIDTTLWKGFLFCLNLSFPGP